MAPRYLASAARRMVAALLVTAAAATGVGAQDAAELYRQGVRAYRAGKTADAIEKFNQSSKADTSYPYPVFALARLYQELHALEHRYYVEAADHYDRLALLLEAQPPGEKERALYQGFYFQGLLCLEGGEFAKALGALNRFLEVYPDYYSLELVHNAVGVAHYYLQNYDEAAEAFQRAIAVKPDFVEARVNVRSIFRRLTLYNEALADARAGRLEDALERVETLRLIAPGYLRGRHLEAGILRDLGRTEEAVCAYRDVLASDPGHPVSHDARMELAKLLESRGQLSEALSLLNQDLRWVRESDALRLLTMKEILRLVDLLKRAP
jgi:tetratricopeptide (TPR) repeat protein